MSYGLIDKLLKEALQKLTPIELDEMNSVSLMNRVDTKFIFHRDELHNILLLAKEHYRVLVIKKQRYATYENLYFDTAELKFYHTHHNGKAGRAKVRMRKYVESERCYFEVKQKNNKGRTVKKRISIPGFEQQLSASSLDFLNEANINDTLLPAMWTQFKRITLVNLNDKERITFDMGLIFRVDKEERRYDNLVIAEVKQSKLNRGSALIRLLKSVHINPYRISKYCIGMAACNSNLKCNAFKEKMLRIHKINQA